jgi:hypothetical protein
MKPVAYGSLYLVLALSLSACSALKPASNSAANSQAQPEVKNDASPPKPIQGDLLVGQATGSYTAKGETVELRYAYAGRGIRFGNEAMIILVTDKPIPAESVAEEIKSQTLLLSEQIKGLEYAIDKDAMWVRFHPSGYQESSNKELKEYKVEGDVVRGVDDGSANLSDKYGRSVKFVAAIVK